MKYISYSLPKQPFPWWDTANLLGKGEDHQPRSVASSLLCHPGLWLSLFDSLLFPVLYSSEEAKEKKNPNFILVQIQPARLQLWPST